MPEHRIKIEYIFTGWKDVSVISGIKKWLFEPPKWRLLENWRYRLPDGEEIILPAGFESDGASVPKLLWSIFSPVDILFLPGLIHDYGYKYNMLWGVSEDGQLYEYGKDKGKSFWDALFRQIAAKENGPRILNNLAWLGLFIGSCPAWQKYRAENNQPTAPNFKL